MAILVGSRGLAKTSLVREPLKPKVVSYSGKGEERADEGQEGIAGTRGNMYKIPKATASIARWGNYKEFK